MTLDYKILWIDDHEDFFRNHEDFIKEHLEEKGFEAQIIKHKSLQDYLEHDDNKGEQIKYDLFLVDLNLDNGHTGNEIIEKIRSNKVLTDIIFYSTNLADVRRSVNDNNIEGVFVTSRNQNDFEEKVTDVIDVTIKKVQDVNNLRGLIMAEVAELDRIKERIIKTASEKIANKELEKYTLKKIKSSSQSNHTKAEKHLNEIDSVTFSVLFGHIGFVDSNKKAMTIGKALEELNINSPVNKATFTQPYIDDILYKRNLFAHIEERDGEDDDGNSCKLIGTIPFTELNCINIRKEIRKYRIILDEIEKQL